MPAKCKVTGKSYHKVTKRSKSMRGTLTRLKSNLQRVKVGNKRVKISTGALRTLKKKTNSPKQLKNILKEYL
jgi:ribosomal protein L28